MGFFGRDCWGNRIANSGTTIKLKQVFELDCFTVFRTRFINIAECNQRFRMLFFGLRLNVINNSGASIVFFFDGLLCGLELRNQKSSGDRLRGHGDKQSQRLE